MLETQEIQQQIEVVADEWIKCSQNPIYFIRTYCKLKDQQKGEITAFDLWPDQEQQILIWEGSLRSIVLKARQLGISWLSGAYVLWNILFKPYFSALVISIKETRAIEYVENVKFMYNHLPPPFKRVVDIAQPTNRLRLSLSNGANLQSESTNPQAGRSTTLNLFVMDEASFIEQPNKVYTAAKPTLKNTNGKALIISTANGFDDFFQPMWRYATQGVNDFTPTFVSWRADPRRTQEWYDRELAIAIAEGKENDFRQEYPSTPEEAFIVTGNTVFPQEVLQDLLNKDPAMYRLGFLNSQHNFVESDTGFLKIWTMPRHSRKYIIGADVAEGIDRKDRSVAVVYDRGRDEKGWRQVAEYAGWVDTDQFGRFLFSLGKFYNFALMAVEMNSYGDSVMNILHKTMKYPRIYRQIRYDDVAKRHVKKIGWKTTKTTKPVMIDSLVQALRERAIKVHSREAMEEMRTFMKDGNSMGASKGNLDDLVIAHALCATILIESPAPAPIRRHVVYKGKRRGLSRSRSYNVDKLFS